MTRAVKSGDMISIHYRGTFEDGEQFDSSYDREEPISVTVGGGQLIEGFNEALGGMEVGQTKKFTVEPSQGYGDVNPEAFIRMPKDVFGEGYDFEVGASVPLQNQQTGHQLNALLTEVEDEHIVCDVNHPLAGKSLTFEVEVLGFSNEDADS